MMLAGLPALASVPLEKPEDFVGFEQLLKETKATAAVVIDDIFALRIIQLAEMYGYKVPENFSVISFNNSIFSTLMHPYLTSIDVDVSELGTMAMRKLMDQIHEVLSTGVRLVVPHKLVKRETVVPLTQE